MNCIRVLEEMFNGPSPFTEEEDLERDPCGFVVEWEAPVPEGEAKTSLDDKDPAAEILEFSSEELQSISARGGSRSFHQVVSASSILSGQGDRSR